MGKVSLGEGPWVREREASCERRAYLSRSPSSLCPALLQPLPEAVGLDQHTLRISKLLLPLVAKPAKVSPVPLIARRSNSSKMTSAYRLITYRCPGV